VNSSVQHSTTQYKVCYFLYFGKLRTLLQHQCDHTVHDKSAAKHQLTSPRNPLQGAATRRIKWHDPTATAGAFFKFHDVTVPLQW